MNELINEWKATKVHVSVQHPTLLTLASILMALAGSKIVKISIVVFAN